MMKLDLNSIKDIKNFVEICSKYPFDIRAKRECYVVDAKSIMGMLSLDLSQPIEIEIYKQVDLTEHNVDKEQETKLMELTKELEKFRKGE